MVIDPAALPACSARISPKNRSKRGGQKATSRSAAREAGGGYIQAAICADQIDCPNPEILRRRGDGVLIHEDDGLTGEFNATVGAHVDIWFLTLISFSVCR